MVDPYPCRRHAPGPRLHADGGVRQGPVRHQRGRWHPAQVYGRAEYIDGLAGVFTVSLGHGNRAIIDAVTEQLNTIAFAPPLHGTNPAAIELAKVLIDLRRRGSERSSSSRAGLRRPRRR